MAERAPCFREKIVAISTHLLLEKAAFTVVYNSSKSPCLQYFLGKSANFTSYNSLSKNGTFRGTYSFRHAISNISPNPLVNDISVLDGDSRGCLRESMALTAIC